MATATEIRIGMANTCLLPRSSLPASQLDSSKGSAATSSLAPGRLLCLQLLNAGANRSKQVYPAHLDSRGLGGPSDTCSPTNGKPPDPVRRRTRHPCQPKRRPHSDPCSILRGEDTSNHHSPTRVFRSCTPSHSLLTPGGSHDPGNGPTKRVEEHTPQTSGPFPNGTHLAKRRNSADHPAHPGPIHSIPRPQHLRSRHNTTTGTNPRATSERSLPSPIPFGAHCASTGRAWATTP